MIVLYRRDVRSSTDQPIPHPGVPFAHLRLDVLLPSIPIHQYRLTGNIGQMRLFGQPFDQPGNVFVEFRVRPVEILGLYVAELLVVGRHDKRHIFSIGNRRVMDGTTGRLSFARFAVLVHTVSSDCCRRRRRRRRRWTKRRRGYFGEVKRTWNDIGHLLVTDSTGLTEVSCVRDIIVMDRKFVYGPQRPSLTSPPLATPVSRRERTTFDNEPR